TTVSTAIISVTANAPNVSITANPSLTIAQGSSATLTASGAATYIWSSGATTPAISVTSAGTYTVTGRTSSGCSATANAVVVKPAGGRLSSSEPVTNWQVVVLGNPSVNEYTEMELRNAIGKTLQVSLSDVSGHVLTVQSLAVQDAIQRVRLRLGSARGIYFLQVSDGVCKQTLQILRP
ncbi:Ig-like domain-containing protein, partial [Spirosoma areae]